MPYWYIDTGFATLLILLAVVDAQLGAVFFGPPDIADFRAEFGVPADAFVVGRHGASDQLNVPFVAEAIEAALQRRKNLWLMLLNTDRFSSHERRGTVWRGSGAEGFRTGPGIFPGSGRRA